MSARALSELPSYRGYRYPAEIISHASLRDVEELLAERGVTVTYVRDHPSLVFEVRPRLRCRTSPATCTRG